MLKCDVKGNLKISMKRPTPVDVVFSFFPFNLYTHSHTHTHTELCIQSIVEKMSTIIFRFNKKHNYLINFEKNNRYIVVSVGDILKNLKKY